MFERLVWERDRMLLGDIVFRLEHYKSEDWELGDDCFMFYKTKELVDLFAAFWSLRKDFRPQSVFELGVWDGGSAVFWFEYFRPRKHVGIDILRRQDSQYFQRYISSRALQERVKTYWGIDQADSTMLREIVEREFSDPLDLVIDDASHLYEQTKASFETLFPLLRPGGLYIVEDWAWSHWQEFQSPDHPWATETELDELIFELVEATASSGVHFSPNLTITPGFAAIERGEFESSALGEFDLERHISRRPQDRRAETARKEPRIQAGSIQVASLAQERGAARNRWDTIKSCQALRVATRLLGVHPLARTDPVQRPGAPQEPASV